MLDLIGIPSGAREHSADHKRAFVVRAIAGIMPLKQTGDRKLYDGAFEISAIDVRRVAVMGPLHRLAGLVHRRREYRGRALAVGSDAKLNEHLTRPACGEFRIADDGGLLGLV